MHHTLSIGALVAFFLYLNRFFAPIQLLVQQYNSFQQGQASILKLRTLLSTEPTVTEAPDAMELPPIEGEIVFDDVTFGYDPERAGAPRRRPAHRAGGDRGLRRPHRRRQVHPGQAHHPLLRPHRRAGAHRRPRHRGT